MKIKFCWCPPGSFTMGSPKDEPEHLSKEDQVSVTLSKGFWMGKFEVTQGEWQKIMGTSVTELHDLPDTNIFGPVTGTGARHPMYFVNHDEALAFCAKLTDQERRAGRLPTDWKFDLPTEAQWEYACRAGTTTATAFGNSMSSTMANFDGSSPYGGASKGKNLDQTTEVGSYKPNDWGLCDMYGNVWEWCADWYVDERSGGRDPAILQSADASERVKRGGGFGQGGEYCRSASRFGYEHGDRSFSQGFRLAAVQSK
ncbi:MAG: formylglycine-generating enzyme family protein [Planctomycetaceae bacterium]